MSTAIPVLTAPPVGPNRADRATFSARVDAWISWEETQLYVQLPLMLAAGKANADEAFVSATAATAAKNLAEIAAATALSVPTATLWVSGTYGAGVAAYSPTNGQIYRNKTAGSRTLDPAIDPTNWWSVGFGTLPVALTGVGVTYTPANREFVTIGTSTATTIVLNSVFNIGDSFDVVVENGLSTNLLNLGTYTFKGQVGGTLYLDVLNVPFTLVKLTATVWGIK